MLAALLCFAAVPAGAQEAAARPAGWQVRFDRAGIADTAMKISAMGGGFHVTTNGRGSGIAWRAAQTASGNFRAVAATSLSGPADGHLEGYGMILGGRDLDAAGQSYTYFLIRRDGAFLIKHRAGAETHGIVDWTPNAAVVKQEGSASADNTLAVETSADSVRFFVNGQKVHAMARAGAQVDGIVGLRVNHQLSVHVAQLTVTPR
jgi:hypothetical protein